MDGRSSSLSRGPAGRTDRMMKQSLKLAPHDHTLGSWKLCFGPVEGRHTQPPTLRSPGLDGWLPCNRRSAISTSRTSAVEQFIEASISSLFFFCFDTCLEAGSPLPPIFDSRTGRRENFLITMMLLSLSLDAFVHPTLSAGSATRLSMPIMNEAAAKATWLAKLEAPAWGASPAAPAAHTMPSMPPTYDAYAPAAPMPMNEDAAKAAWLAKLDNEASWKNGPAAAAPMPMDMPVYAESPMQMSEAAAKAAWLSKLDNQPFWLAGAGMMSEDAAKAAWLSKLDNEPFWLTGAPAAAPAPNMYVADPYMAPMSEDAAKAAWLAKLDNEASWKNGPPAAAPMPDPYMSAPVADTYMAPTSEAAAKAKWLASLDNEPAWATGAPAPVAQPMQGYVAPTQVYEPMQGHVVPTQSYDAEAAAKAKWLAARA